MPRIIGEIELSLKGQTMSVEDVRTLLQAIRDWEQTRKADIFVGINAPGMTNEETKFVFDNIKPPFEHQSFIPFER